MKQVAITGGGGYIGGPTAIYFKEQGWEVTVVDRNNFPKDLSHLLIVSYMMNSITKMHLNNMQVLIALFTVQDQVWSVQA